MGNSCGQQASPGSRKKANRHLSHATHKLTHKHTQAGQYPPCSYTDIFHALSTVNSADANTGVTASEQASTCFHCSQFFFPPLLWKKVSGSQGWPQTLYSLASQEWGFGIHAAKPRQCFQFQGKLLGNSMFNSRGNAILLPKQVFHRPFALTNVFFSLFLRVISPNMEAIFAQKKYLPPYFI